MGVNSRYSGEGVRNLRQMRRLTQIQLAVAARLSVGKLSEIENGQEPPDLPTLRSLLHCLGYSQGDLQKVETLLRRPFRDPTAP
jgi:transcriptional regulator with XRE-family HTH domain